MEFIDCPCTGKTLARLIRPAILTLLAQEPLHGYELLKRLSPMAICQGQNPDPTGVYRALRDMETEQLISADWDVSGRGPAKRRYVITASGQACLDRWMLTLDSYQQAITQLLNLARAIRDEQPPRLQSNPGPSS